MTAFAFIAVGALLTAASLYVSRAFWLNRPPVSAVVTCEHEPYDDTELREILAGHAVELKDFTLAIDHGISHVKRAQRRINATITRARKELSDLGVESPGLDAEFEELREGDGDGSGEGELPAVPEGVGEVAAHFDTIGLPGEGLTEEHFRLAGRLVNGFTQ